MELILITIFYIVLKEHPLAPEDHSRCSGKVGKDENDSDKYPAANGFDLGAKSLESTDFNTGWNIERAALICEVDIE